MTRPWRNAPLHAAAVLRILLDDPRVDLDDLDWAELRTAAQAGGVLVRLADRLARRGEPVPAGFGTAAVQARTRTEQMVTLVDRIGEACRRYGVSHAFLKVTERYPDPGGDLDLLVAPRSAEVDHLLLRDIPAAPYPRGVRDRLTGAATYRVDSSLVLDIHHGRLGQFGERGRFAEALLGRAREVALPGANCRAPIPEDHLLVQALHQVYSRPAFRLADVYWTINTLRRRRFQWRTLVETARDQGFIPGLNAYLAYIDGVHHRLFARPLLPSEAAALRFPDTRLAGRLYLSQVRAAVAGRHWSEAVRLCSLPVVAAEAGLRRLAHRTRRREGVPR